MPNYTDTPSTQNVIDNGSDNWVSPSNAVGAANGSEAEMLNITNESQPDHLELSNFGFSIPGGHTVVGIRVVVRARDSDLLDSGDVRVTVNKTLDGGGGGE